MLTVVCSIAPISGEESIRRHHSIGGDDMELIGLAYLVN